MRCETAYMVVDVAVDGYGARVLKGTRRVGYTA
jgi:hypothetical protein